MAVSVDVAAMLLLGEIHLPHASLRFLDPVSDLIPYQILLCTLARYFRMHLTMHIYTRHSSLYHAHCQMLCRSPCLTLQNLGYCLYNYTLPL